VDLISFKDRLCIIDDVSYSVDSPVFNGVFWEFLSRLWCGLKIVGLMRKLNYQCDTFQILGWKEELSFLFLMIRSRCTKCVLLIFGAHTFKPGIQLYTFKLFQTHFDRIVFTSTTFGIKHSHHIENQKKIKFAYLPLPALDVIENLKESASDRTKDKIEICCSSCLGEYENHFKVIDSLAEITIPPEKIKLNFMLNYGGTPDYEQRVLNYIDEKLARFEVNIIDEFMNAEGVAEFKLRNDIHINVRTTDQFSGAMVEALYAGSVVIVGDWLPYGELDDLGISWVKISSTDGLKSALESTIRKLSTHKNAAAHNTEILRRYLPSECMEKWDSIYYEMNQDASNN
jgi:hypothetical protein